MRKSIRFAASLVLPISFAAPLLAAAQSGVNLNAVTPYSNGIINAINNILVPVLMAIAFLVFVWGIYKYFILGAADEKSREDGRNFTMWSLIGFVILLSLWGLVNLLMGTLGLSSATSSPPVPTIR